MGGSQVAMSKHVVGSVILFSGLAVILCLALDGVDQSGFESALTNLAAVGGIASGLSFASLSIFTLNGTYQKKVLAQIGNKVRSTLFYLLFIVMLVSIFSGIAVVWADKGWIRYIFPLLVFLVLESFYLTFRIVFTAYEWESDPEPPDLSSLPTVGD